LSEKISFKTITLPNILSVLRIVLIPVFIYFYLDQQKILALAVLFIASATDLLDGIAARAFNQRSRVGYILDPLADKLLMDSTYILFTIKALPLTIYVPKWLTLTIVSRDLIMVLGAGLITILTPDRILKPHWLGKATTTAQMVTAILVLFINVSSVKIPGMTGIFWFTGILTIISGFYYILREISNVE